MADARALKNVLAVANKMSEFLVCKTTTTLDEKNISDDVLRTYQFLSRLPQRMETRRTPEMHAKKCVPTGVLYTSLFYGSGNETTTRYINSMSTGPTQSSFAFTSVLNTTRNIRCQESNQVMNPIPHGGLTNLSRTWTTSDTKRNLVVWECSACFSIYTTFSIC